MQESREGLATFDVLRADLYADVSDPEIDRCQNEGLFSGVCGKDSTVLEGPEWLETVCVPGRNLFGLHRWRDASTAGSLSQSDCVPRSGTNVRSNEGSLTQAVKDEVDLTCACHVYVHWETRVKWDCQSLRRLACFPPLGWSSGGPAGGGGRRAQHSYADEPQQTRFEVGAHAPSVVLHSEPRQSAYAERLQVEYTVTKMASLDRRRRARRKGCPPSLDAHSLQESRNGPGRSSEDLNNQARLSAKTRMSVMFAQTTESSTSAGIVQSEVFLKPFLASEIELLALETMDWTWEFHWQKWHHATHQQKVLFVVSTGINSCKKGTKPPATLVLGNGPPAVNWLPTVIGFLKDLSQVSSALDATWLWTQAETDSWSVKAASKQLSDPVGVQHLNETNKSATHTIIWPFEPCCLCQRRCQRCDCSA